MPDTGTEEGRRKRLYQIVKEYEKAGNVRALVRMIGGSADDFRDANPGSHPDENK